MLDIQDMIHPTKEGNWKIGEKREISFECYKTINDLLDDLKEENKQLQRVNGMLFGVLADYKDREDIQKLVDAVK